MFAAEGLKQHRRIFGSPLVVFSMLVWPVLTLAATYYTVLPVIESPGAAQRWPLVAAARTGWLAFLAAGALAYTFFFSLVQSAWHFSFERVSGTLEALFLTPANRMALVVANGSGALVQNAWLFGVFAIAAAVATGTLHVAHPGMYAVAVVALLVPAVAWGAFLNSLLMFSRDSAFLYTLLDDPLWFVAGVRLPLFALPGLDQGDRAGLPADHEPGRAARRAAGRAGVARPGRRARVPPALSAALFALDRRAAAGGGAARPTDRLAPALLACRSSLRSDGREPTWSA